MQRPAGCEGTEGKPYRDVALPPCSLAPWIFRRDTGENLRTAFYFNEDVAFRPSLMAPHVAVATAIINVVPGRLRHVHVRAGTLPWSRIASSRESLIAVVESLLGIETPTWSTMSPSELFEGLGTTSVVAYLTQGISAKESRSIHDALTSTGGYMGAIEAKSNTDISWILYGHLPVLYRIVGSELRIPYRKYELEVEDNRDHGFFQEWQQSGLFSTVIWEDTGAQGTIFDPYDSVDHARLTGEVEELVGAQFSNVVDEILMRIAQLDPRLFALMHGALKSFEQFDTADSLAHVSVSCRRLIERLADALYPPRNAPVNGKDVGPKEYRNRLWAYVNEHLHSESNRTLVLTTLGDIGSRINKLDSAASRGVHADVAPSEVRRLLISLTTLVYDLLTLASPLLEMPDGPYKETVSRMIKEMLRDRDRPI